MASGDAYDVFLSYARSDGAAAAELNGWLCAQGLRTFFDRSELRRAFGGSRRSKTRSAAPSAVAILVGKHGIGNTQQYERELALIRQTGDAAFPVIPVLMPGCDSPPTGFLQLLTWVDLSKGANVLQQTDSLAALRAALRGETVAASAIRASICPYRGLEPFREEDAAFFCGRDDAIRDLVARVQEHSFVAVVGPSGSGKSSLVFAGPASGAAQAAPDDDVGCRHVPAGQVAACARSPKPSEPRRTMPARPRSTRISKAKPQPIARATRICSPASSTTASTLRPKSRTAC